MALQIDKFHDIDTPFAAFIFGDKRLRPSETLGELVLCQPAALRAFTISPQKAQWTDLSSLRARVPIGAGD
jgi:hypothetical protein